ncbi:MAG: ROK family protein [Mobilicoccus sp.]|nr:ROK family protein [Mobilicoccus sp.]
MTADAHYLVLDVGGSGIKYATATAGGTLGERSVLPTSYTTHEEFIDAVVGIIDGHADSAGPALAGVAFSTCGEVDPESGHMLSGGLLTFNAGENYITSLRERCDLRVTVENDANCALLAEMRDGALADVDTGVVMVLGSAVGGAVMLDRRVLHGARFHAGNLSALITDLARPDEHMYTSMGAAFLVEAYRQRRGDEPDIADGRDFFERLSSGSPAAAASLQAYAARLSALIFNLQVVLDVEAFAVGGGISAQDALIDAVAAEVERRFDAVPLDLPRPAIAACRYRNDANLLGALWHHLTASAAS